MILFKLTSYHFVTVLVLNTVVAVVVIVQTGSNVTLLVIGPGPRLNCLSSTSTLLPIMPRSALLVHEGSAVAIIVSVIVIMLKPVDLGGNGHQGKPGFVGVGRRTERDTEPRTCRFSLSSASLFHVGSGFHGHPGFVG